MESCPFLGAQIARRASQCCHGLYVFYFWLAIVEELQTCTCDGTESYVADTEFIQAAVRKDLACLSVHKLLCL